MTRLELYAVMNEIVRLATGIPMAILANDNHGSPTGSYCSIEPFAQLDERGQANQDFIANGTDDVDHVIKRQILAEVSFNFYRDDAKRFAMLLKQASKRPDVHLILHNAKVGWMGTSNVRDLTALQSGKYEQRSQISVTVSFEEITTITTNAINTVPLQMQLENGTIVEETSIT